MNAAIVGLGKINGKIKVFEKINTALPLRKQKKFDEILEKLYAKRSKYIINHMKELNE